MKFPRKKAWGGRFAAASNPLLESFNASISFDKRLYAEDITGSLAHARSLKKIGVLSTGELKKIQRGLLSIQKEIIDGQFRWSHKNEDVHMAIESRLISKIGPAGAKLHTARSRNDQVALDMRLFCKKEIQQLIAEVTSLQKTLVTIAERKGFVALPGYTHLQRAQPILLAHYWLAYFEMLQRDRERLFDILKRVDLSPLGSGALAGSPFPIDREFVARQLKMDGVTHNSVDAVSDRDFVAELLFAIALLMTHLSRLAEEMVLWSSQEFGFIDLPQEFCTGSSMMPQKVNPDVPELIRGKTGRAYGNLMAILTVLKGLPLAYNKDLQEDKEPLFDSVDTAHAVLQVLTAMIPGITINVPRMLQATSEGFLLATDLADYLVSKKIPFRSAHEIVGKMVQYCLQRKTVLEKLSLGEMKRFSKAFGPDVKKRLSIEAAVNQRNSTGGTAVTSVRRELARAKRLLGKSLKS